MVRIFMNQTLFRHKFLIPDDMVAKLQTKLRSIDATEEHDNEDNVSISSSVSQDKYRHCHHQHQQHHHMHSGHETPKVPFIYYVSTIWDFFDPLPSI